MTGLALPIRRSQASPGESPGGASACRCSRPTTRARTRSRPMPYGRPSRRASSTIRRSASASIRQRYEPSDTMIGSVGLRMPRATAPGAAPRPSAASCLTPRPRRGVGGRGPARRAIRSSTVDCCDLDLAERRQHRGDVGQERPVRPDDQHAGPAQPLAVQVEQVRGPVQADRGLAGAGRALHADRVVQVGADQLVLLGLDGGDDVAHRPDAGPLDLGGQDPARGAELLAAVEVLVLEAGQLALRRSRTGAGSRRPAGRATLAR